MAYIDPANEILRQITELGYRPPTPQLSFAQAMGQQGLAGGVRPVTPLPAVTPPGTTLELYRPNLPIPRVLGGSQAALGRGFGPAGSTAAPGGVPLTTPGGGGAGIPPRPPGPPGPGFAPPPAGGAGIPSGILGRLVTNPSATGAARFVAPRFLTEAGKLRLGAIAGRVGAGATLGTLGATVINAALPESGVRHGLANVLTGAGIGATAGSIVPGVGTVAGAIIGGTAGLGTAIAGGLDDLFGGGKGPKTEDDAQQLNQAIAQSNLNEQAKSEILTIYNTLYSLAENDEQKAEAYNTAKQLIVEKVQTSAQEQQQIDAMLASQAMVQQFISPIAQNIVGSAEQQRDLLLGLAEGLPEQFRATAIAQANERVASANRIAGAYANQMIGIPQITALQLEQQRQQNVGQDQTSADLQALLAGLQTGG